MLAAGRPGATTPLAGDRQGAIHSAIAMNRRLA
jgi:hypothetical protein